MGAHIGGTSSRRFRWCSHAALTFDVQHYKSHVCKGYKLGPVKQVNIEISNGHPLGEHTQVGVMLN